MMIYLKTDSVHTTISYDFACYCHIGNSILVQFNIIKYYNPVLLKETYFDIIIIRVNIGK